MAKLKITLVQGLIGRSGNQRATVRGLGLRKRHQTVVREDNAAIRGMINKVEHLVDVEPVEE